MTDQENQPQEEQQFVQQPEHQPERQPESPRQPYYEEKAEEKYEKEDEKLREKSHQDPLSALIWALILIWAGLVFLADNLNWLGSLQSQLNSQWDKMTIDLSVWWVIMAGAGALIFIEAIVRLVIPAYRSSSRGNYVLAAVFLGIGFGGILGWDLVWPFILIGMGLAALASALIRGRK